MTPWVQTTASSGLWYLANPTLALATDRLVQRRRKGRGGTEECRTMTAHSTPSDGQTRLAYILGVPLAPHCQRQWPQMGEVVSGRDLIAQVEGNFPELT
jgi:hypothetical protein